MLSEYLSCIYELLRGVWCGVVELLLWIFVVSFSPRWVYLIVLIKISVLTMKYSWTNYHTWAAQLRDPHRWRCQPVVVLCNLTVNSHSAVVFNILIDQFDYKVPWENSQMSQQWVGIFYTTRITVLQQLSKGRLSKVMVVKKIAMNSL